VRIHLSAIEASVHALHAAATCPPRCVLTSYHYAKAVRRDTRLDPDLWMRCLVGASHRMADSGAFSFLYGSGDRSTDFDRYLAEYIEWLRGKTRAGLLDTWVELDLSGVLGYDWVHRQRDAIVGAGLGRGMITVWHSDADWSYWLSLIDEALRPGRSGYVAIEGHHDDREPLDYARFIAAAYQRGVRVHGFMITGSADLERFPFYSVDSTSWLAGSRYGQVSRLSRTGVGARGAKDGTAPSPGSNWRLHVPALVESIRTWQEVERRVTESWAARGVDWGDA
jgi:hypothetical protein